MDRRRVFAGQYVTFEEWRQIDDDTENADRNQSKDNGLVGIVRGLLVQEQAVPDLTVKITAGEAYDKSGKRIIAASDIAALDVSQDSSSVSTQVANSGNAKVVSVFIEADRADSNPRTDETSTDVDYDSLESYKITVIQGSEVTDPPAHGDYPALDDDKILLADIVRVFGDTSITTAKISMETRPSPSVLGREDQVSLNPQPAAGEKSIRRNKVIDQPSTGKPYADCALGDLLQYHNEFVTDVATAGATTGGALVGADAYSPTPGGFSGLSAGTVRSQLRTLADGLSGSVESVNISYPGSSPTTWADGSSIAAGSVESAFDDVVSGIGSASGEELVGAVARTNFGSGADQVSDLFDDIDSKAVWLAGTQTISGAKTFSASPTIASGIALLPGSVTSTIGNASNNFGSVYCTEVVRASTSQSIQFDTDANKNVWITTRNAAGSAQVIVLTVNPTATVLDSLAFNPQTDSASDLGSTSKLWRTVYAVDGFRCILGPYSVSGYSGGALGPFLVGPGSLPRAGEITALMMTVFTASGGGASITATGQTGASDSSLTLTYNGTGDTTIHSVRAHKSGGTNVAFSAGSYVAFKLASTGTITTTDIDFWIEITY